ncbi:ankyrin repeat [Nesidiocoris tenuis]|uniref:Ankyrin repeat n=1 Tax=Nesidiocoris tenuis TaxID=355587 RepID=A0ABN7B5E4_9HEMI|nr:ankyrin repeat [Nesidiocoris tenuis]
MKKVLNFVKGKKDDKGPSKMNPQISVEITNPSGQKIPSDDEHIIGLQMGFGYSIDVNGKDKSMLKIHKAAWFGNLDKLKLYAKKGDVNVLDSQSRTCLHLAVAQGHTEVAWYLLNNNASTTTCDSDGLTPFLKAIECGQKDCANLLIECGVDVNSTDGDGNNGLHIASRSGFYNIASLLLKEGVNLNQPNNSGNYPLHMATSCDHRDIVELLIKFGANVQVLDRERRTPLMLAARNGLTSIIKVLLENGALLETADSNGWTAEDYAQFGGHHDLIELLETKKKEVSLDQSDKLSVQSSDQSEHVNFEASKPITNGNEETTDSPRSCVMPPALEPPRSWDLIQSGVMEQETSLESRKSLLTLGNLKKSYEAGSNELIVSLAEPAPSSLSPSGDIPADMRLSPEPLSLAPTPERRTRSPLERHPSVDLPSDSDSPLQGLSNEDLNSDLGHPDIAELPKDATLNDFSKINHNVITDLADLDKPSNTANNNIFNSSASSKDQGCSRNPTQEDNAYSIESSASYDNLDGRNNQENELAGVSTSLDNIDYENGKSLSIEIVQSTGHLDDTLSITTTKNIFRECHSLELLEAEIGDTRSYKNSKRHHRNKSITLTGQPQLWKSVSTLPKTCSFDRGSIDAQLMCYDEALRQLAKVNKPAEAKDAQMNTSPVKAADPEPKREETAENSIKSLDQIEILDRVNSASPDSYHGRMSAEFQTPTDEELEFLERENFPPPPIYFLQNEDSELCQLDCDDKSIQIDVLPMPISMLTPIKETQLECDSLSVAETIENEHSISEIHSEAMPPNHFNVEVIVNSKTPEPSQSLDDAINLPDAPDITEASLIVDDVFTEDTTLAEPYDKYFVDLKALEMVPSAVDFSKIVFPADSPSPKKSKKIRGSNTGKAASTMRGAGVGGGSKDTDNDIDDDAIEDEGVSGGDSDEDDPPFWQNTDKGGYFVRQDTIVAKECKPLPPFTRLGADSRLPSSSGRSLARKSDESPTLNSEAETASASDTPRLSPMDLKEPNRSHLCASLFLEANGRLEEKAATLMDDTERLKYELENARQGEEMRSDTIAILQCQVSAKLSRLEAQYAEAQEEVCVLKQKADCAELELKHLRELCSCLSRDKSDRHQLPLKQLVDQATASTPTEEDYKQIHMQIMIKHLEDSKKLEEEKNHQLVRHLEEVLSTNQNMVSEKEALIAQNIADVRKLQEDTICWKDRYEELAAKLELLDKRLDPRLIEAQDTIATLKRTIAIMQQEKSYSKRDAFTYTETPVAETKPSQSTMAFIKTTIPTLKTMIDDFNAEKIEHLVMLQKDNGCLKDEFAKITTLITTMASFLDEIKLRTDLDLEVMDSQRSTMSDFATKMDLDRIRCTQNENFSFLKMKEEVISETQNFLMNKLGEINTLIQRQIQEQEKLERTRTNSEVSFKQKLDLITTLIQSDLSNVKAAIKQIEAGEKPSKKRIEMDPENLKDRPSKNRND